MMMMLDCEDVDPEGSVSMTWSVDANGTMRHKTTGTKVSPEEGITFQGTEYKLGPKDIEYEEGSHLGAGACGVVMKGYIKTTGEPVAVKTIKVDDKGKLQQLLNELKGLVTAGGCPHLVQWYAGFLNKKTSAVHVALEFMDRGSLADLKKRLQGQGVPSQYLANISQQVMLGLCHLHDRHFLHRDIKPENILHNSAGEVKLTDFGIAKDLDSTLAMAGTFVGTVTYMSPERCLGETYDLGSDIWSVGMVYFELATGRYPFADVSTFPKLFDHLCEKPEPRLDEGQFPPPLCDFVAQCLTRDVARRPETRTLLNHEYVTVGVPTQQDLSAWLATFC